MKVREENGTMNNEFAHDKALVNEFLTESEELLQRMDQDMVELEAAPDNSELLNRIFRALHTIKGTSGFLGFEPLVRVSHSAEDILNSLRRGEIQLNRRIIDGLLAARDQLVSMLRDIRSEGLKEYQIDGLLASLEAVQGKSLSSSELEAAIQIADNKQSSEVIEPISHKTDSQLPLSSAPAVAPADSKTALQKQSSGADSTAQSMRVDVRKLDELINLIGELVLERNRLMRLSRDLNLKRLTGPDLDSALNQSAARLSFITEELQAAGLRTRMVPIETLFRKFPRMVRDTAHLLNKEVELVLQGEDTELDKTMVELIGDPLVHLIRNSLDHGLEPPDARMAAGKPRMGTILLEAKQEGDQITILIHDDGAGIDPARIARKAIEKGFTTSERVRTMTPGEIMDFVFMPGFSTAEKVNDLSGRGVGMDVVRSNLKKLNGTIDLESVLGQGTTVRLRLPLTLAVLPVLLVEAADEIYGLPLRSVIETARIPRREIHVIEGGEVLRLRGEVLPLLRLSSIFRTPSSSDSDPQLNIVILGIAEKRVALAVDRLIGQESTVIKPLGNFLRGASTLAGATISGDGRVRLVLDPAGLLQSADDFVQRTTGAMA